MLLENWSRSEGDVYYLGYGISEDKTKYLQLAHSTIQLRLRCLLMIWISFLCLVIGIFIGCSQFYAKYLQKN